MPIYTEFVLMNGNATHVSEERGGWVYILEPPQNINHFTFMDDLIISGKRKFQVS